MSINFLVNFTIGFWLIPLVVCWAIVLFWYLKGDQATFADGKGSLGIALFFTVGCLLTRFLP